MRKSTKVWAILLAILMVVSVFPTSVFASGSVISDFIVQNDPFFIIAPSG